MSGLGRAAGASRIVTLPNYQSDPDTGYNDGGVHYTTDWIRTLIILFIGLTFSSDLNAFINASANKETYLIIIGLILIISCAVLGWLIVRTVRTTDSSRLKEPLRYCLCLFIIHVTSATAAFVIFMVGRSLDDDLHWTKGVSPNILGFQIATMVLSAIPWCIVKYLIRKHK